jgi:phosphatidylglycerol:prolipoprotein diacylglycerol transferase
MLPGAINLGPVIIDGYGLALVVAVLAALFFLNITAPRAGVSPKKAFDLAFWLIIVGLLGSRAAYVVFHLKSYVNQPLNSLKYWEGGLMFQGGLLSGLLLTIILAFLKRLNFLVMADAIAPALALGQAIGRIGCLLAGCCYGRIAPEKLPIALTFPLGSIAPSGLPLYPTQIMESVGLFLIIIVLTLVLRRPRPVGLVLAYYLALSGLLRFAVDFYRGDNRGPKILLLAPTSWAALAILVTGLTLGIIILNRRKKLSQKRHDLREIAPRTENLTQN